MLQHDLKEEPLEHNGVTFAYGLDALGLTRAVPSDRLTFVYSPNFALLYLGETEILVPEHSVTRIAPGIEARFLPSEQERETSSVVVRVQNTLPTLDVRQATLVRRMEERTGATYGIDMTQWSPLIRSYDDDAVLVFPHESRQDIPSLRQGKSAHRWLVNTHRGQPLSITAARWMTGVRERERLHLQQVIEESYIGVAGIGALEIEKTRRPITPGVITIVQPGDIHMMREAHNGPQGFYGHVTVQYPPVPYELGDKVVVPECITPSSS